MHLITKVSPKDSRKRIDRRERKDKELQNEIHQFKTNANATSKEDNSRPRRQKTDKNVTCEDDDLHVSILAQLMQGDVFAPVCSQSALISRSANKVTYVSNP